MAEGCRDARSEVEDTIPASSSYRSSGSAALAEGERVFQAFLNSEVNVVSGDLITQQHNTTIINVGGLTSNQGLFNGKPKTHVANGYHEDILACVRAIRIEVYEEDMAVEAKVGGSGLPVSAGVTHSTRCKRKYVTEDPGFVTIKPGCYLAFAESGTDGRVFVTIKIGSDIPHANFQVYNGCNVLVDKEGSLRNVQDDQIWTGTSGESHLKETPASPLPSEDPATEVLRRYRNKGQVKKCFGTFGNDVGRMKYPHGISSTLADDIVVADACNDRIQCFKIFDANEVVKEVFGNKGTSKGQFNVVHDVCVTSRGWIVASGYNNHRIQIFDEQGKFVRKFGSFGSGDGKLHRPAGLATDDKGLIYVCDRDNDRVQVFSEKGKFVRKFGSEWLNKPRYLSVTSNGKVVVSDPGNHSVHVFDLYGRHLFQFGTFGTNVSQFQSPRGIAIDDHGNIIVADSLNNRVQVFTSDGAFVSCFGSDGSEPGQMKKPEGVCLLSDGRIAVSDSGNHRVQIF